MTSSAASPRTSEPWLGPWPARSKSPSATGSTTVTGRGRSSGPRPAGSPTRPSATSGPAGLPATTDRGTSRHLPGRPAGTGHGPDGAHPGPGAAPAGVVPAAPAGGVPHEGADGVPREEAGGARLRQGGLTALATRARLTRLRPSLVRHPWPTGRRARPSGRLAATPPTRSRRAGRGLVGLVALAGRRVALVGLAGRRVGQVNRGRRRRARLRPLHRPTPSGGRGPPCATTATGGPSLPPWWL